MELRDMEWKKFLVFFFKYVDCGGFVLMFGKTNTVFQVLKLKKKSMSIERRVNVRRKWSNFYDFEKKCILQRTYESHT